MRQDVKHPQGILIEHEIAKLTLFYRGCLKQVFDSMHRSIAHGVANQNATLMQHCVDHVFLIAFISHQTQFLSEYKIKHDDTVSIFYTLLQHHQGQEYTATTGREIEAHWRQYFMHREHREVGKKFFLHPMMTQILKLLNYYHNAHHGLKAKQVDALLMCLKPCYKALSSGHSQAQIKQVLNSNVDDVLAFSAAVQNKVDEILDRFHLLSEQLQGAYGPPLSGQDGFKRYTYAILGAMGPVIRGQDIFHGGEDAIARLRKSCLACCDLEHPLASTDRFFNGYFDPRNQKLALAAGIAFFVLQSFQLIEDLFMIPAILAGLAILSQSYDIISNYMYSRSRIDRLAQCYLPMIAEHGFGLYDNDPQEGANDEDVLLSVRRAL